MGGTIKDGQKGISHDKILNEKQTIRRIKKHLVWFNVDQVNGVVFDVEDTDTIIHRLMNSPAFSELLKLFPSDEIREVCLQWIIRMKFRSFEDFCQHLIKTTTGYIPDVYQVPDIESGAVTEITPGWFVRSSVWQALAHCYQPCLAVSGESARRRSESSPVTSLYTG